MRTAQPLVGALEILPVADAAGRAWAGCFFPSFDVAPPFRLGPLFRHQQPRVIPGQADRVTDLVRAQVDAVDAISILPREPHFHLYDSRSNLCTYAPLRSRHSVAEPFRLT